MELFFGLLTIVLGLISYGWYISGITHRSIRPHAFSWLIWAVLNSFIAYQQVAAGAGPGAWATIVSALAGFTIFILTLKRGEHHVTKLDMTCFVAAAAILVSYAAIHDAFISVILASVVFIVGFIPTFRKAFHSAADESILSFTLNAFKFAFALLALEVVTPTTAVYPATLMVMNVVFVGFLLMRLRHSHPRQFTTVVGYNKTS